jgi:hypothetical protein
MDLGRRFSRFGCRWVCRRPWAHPPGTELRNKPACHSLCQRAFLAVVTPTAFGPGRRFPPSIVGRPGTVDSERVFGSWRRIAPWRSGDDPRGRAGRDDVIVTLANVGVASLLAALTGSRFPSTTHLYASSLRPRMETRPRGCPRGRGTGRDMNRTLGAIGLLGRPGGLRGSSMRRRCSP